MFGRKKLKNQIEKLKREISYLKSQTVGLRFDVDTIDSIVAVPIYVPKEEQINFAKKMLVNSISDTLKENPEKYIEFKDICVQGMDSIQAKIRILKKDN